MCQVTYETEMLVKDVEEEEDTWLHCQYYECPSTQSQEKRELTFSKKGHGGPT